MKIEMDLC